MVGRELIQLDAKIVSVIGKKAFRVELANGHRLVAYAGRGEGPRAAGLRVGETVRVELSPCDMSKGPLVFGQEGVA